MERAAEAAVRTPERDLHDAAAGALREHAIEQITERLLSGKQVGRATLRELIDADLHGSRAEITTAEVTDVLLAHSGERAAKADQVVAGVIERFILGHPELVEEYAAEIEATDVFEGEPE